MGRACSALGRNRRRGRGGIEQHLAGPVLPRLGYHLRGTGRTRRVHIDFVRAGAARRMAMGSSARSRCECLRTENQGSQCTKRRRRRRGCVGHARRHLRPAPRAVLQQCDFWPAVCGAERPRRRVPAAAEPHGRGRADRCPADGPGLCPCTAPHASEIQPNLSVCVMRLLGALAGGGARNRQSVASAPGPAAEFSASTSGC